MNIFFQRPLLWVPTLLLIIMLAFLLFAQISHIFPICSKFFDTRLIEIVNILVILMIGTVIAVGVNMKNTRDNRRTEVIFNIFDQFTKRISCIFSTLPAPSELIRDEDKSEIRRQFQLASNNLFQTSKVIERYYSKRAGDESILKIKELFYKYKKEITDEPWRQGFITSESLSRAEYIMQNIYHNINTLKLNFL